MHPYARCECEESHIVLVLDRHTGTEEGGCTYLELQFPLLLISPVPYSVIVALYVWADASAAAVASTRIDLYTEFAIVGW
jgi:hypothetical protein